MSKKARKRMTKSRPVLGFKADAPNKAAQLYQQALEAKRGGDSDTAQRLYKRLLRVAPRHANAHHNLGVIAQERNDHQRALELFRHAATLQPDNAHFKNAIGSALLNLRDVEGATAEILKALKLDPEYADAYCKLGAALAMAKKNDEAVHCYQRAIALDPKHAKAYNNLGNALREKEDYVGALQCYRKVLELAPNSFYIYNNMAIALGHLERYDDAARSLIEALKYNPESPETYASLADIFHIQGKYGAARQAMLMAIRLRPDDTRFVWNLAAIELSAGNLEDGWEHYEAGLAAGVRIFTDYGVPMWEGQSLEGKTIAVGAEQGLGDELWFASCIPDLMDVAKHCVINCDKRLEPLFTRSFPDATLYMGRRPNERAPLDTLPPIDYQVPAGSLPRYFRRSFRDFPSKAGYLKVDPKKSEYWGQRLSELGSELRVGVTWRSGRVTMMRNRHYINDLSELMPILHVPGVRFINLQYDDDSIREFLDLSSDPRLTLSHFEQLDLRDDLDGLAGLLSALDLVIGIGTAATVLASVIGVPTWLLTPAHHLALLGTNEYFPFYPSVQPFIQSQLGSWDDEIKAIANKLEHLAQTED